MFLILVPSSNYHENPSLGIFVANQRTAYKQYLAGERGNKSLTIEKISALESIGFCWEERHNNWYDMFTRLKKYKSERQREWLCSREDHERSNARENDIDDSVLCLPEFFYVPPEDLSNRDLRLWITVQRREYKNRITPNKRTSMTLRRKNLLEEIGFPFQVTGNTSADGPSVEDWKKLFDQMREKGINSKLRPKEHWFEGQSLAEENVNIDREWKDDDLLDLWNSMNDDEDE